MKSLVLLLAVAANAQYFFPTTYTTHHSPLVYTNIHHPYYSAVSAGNVKHTVLKREAEAQWPHFYNYQGYSHYYPYTHGIKTPTYSNDAVTPFGYANKGHYYANSAGTVHVAKREAEAQWPYFYNNYHGYSHYYPYTHGIKAPTYSNDAVSPFGYAAKGQYYANSAGTVHVAKREAEADPLMVYPSVYSHYAPSVAAYQPYMYSPYTYAHHMPIVQAKTYSNDAEKDTDYAAKGKYVAETAGSLHIAKREAGQGFHDVFGKHIVPVGHNFFSTDGYGNFYGSHGALSQTLPYAAYQG